jgi:hypothetical protein
VGDRVLLASRTAPSSDRGAPTARGPVRRRFWPSGHPLGLAADGEREADRLADRALLRRAPVNVRGRGGLTAAQAGGLAGGRPLADREQAFFGSRFGVDFSRVRVHADAGAAESARAIGAAAYTFGSHIMFGAGRYAPGTAAGRRLLAHELAHVIQQSGQLGSGGAPAPRVQRFTTDEHVEIANLAYEHIRLGQPASALRDSPLASVLREGSRFRLGDKVRTYGDIVADADFFEHFEDMIVEEGERPGRLGMGVLAARNVPHFTPHNIRLWKDSHRVAVDQMLFAHRQLELVREFLRDLSLHADRARAALHREDDATAEGLVDEYARRLNPAQQARMEAIGKAARAIAREALMRNAFADHFLTDAFSAGHVVAPRAEILQEARVRLDEPVGRLSLLRGAILGPTWGELGELRAQARSLAWHDLDNFYGVEVGVPDPGFGDWIACGDRCSQQTQGSHWQATRALAVRATTESIRDLWEAALTGTDPKDFGSVLDLVPQPTWRGYPAWGTTEWENQLRYIRGEDVPHAPSETLRTFASGLLPSEHCSLGDLSCMRATIGTDRDWVRRYSFRAWVLPWIARIKAQATSRYRF